MFCLVDMLSKDKLRLMKESENTTVLLFNCWFPLKTRQIIQEVKETQKRKHRKSLGFILVVWFPATLYVLPLRMQIYSTLLYLKKRPQCECIYSRTV